MHAAFGGVFFIHFDGFVIDWRADAAGEQGKTLNIKIYSKYETSAVHPWLKCLNVSESSD